MINFIVQAARVAVLLLVVASLLLACSPADAGGCGRAQVIAAPVQVQAYYAPAIQLQAVQAQAYAAPVQLQVQAAQYYAAPVQLQVQAQVRHHHAQAAIVAPVVKLKPVRFPNLPRNQ